MPGPRFIDITGNRFNYLVALKKIGVTKNGNAVWLFQCDCGSTTKHELPNVKGGTVKSCGCFRKKVMQKQLYGFKHGFSMTSVYKAWSAAYHRCTDPMNRAYVNYGGRGIKFDKDFMGWPGLIRWINELGPRPSNKHSVDRINNNGDYAPGNIRWATQQQQSQNRRKRLKCAL